MVAVDIELREDVEMEISVEPEALAEELIGSVDADWLRALVDALDREVRTSPLDRLTTLWDLSNAAAGRLFGVSRQAFAKWLESGPPPDRVDDVTAVDDITELLDRYVRRERIPAVVRRRAENLGGKSLLEALEEGQYQRSRKVVVDAFDLRRVQP